VRVDVLHGPNLNLLGTREPELYGAVGLEAVDRRLQEVATELDVEIDTFQSNHEGALIDRVQEQRGDGYVINAGGYTHTSVALRDAFLAVGRPFVEVHVSNVYARETFRHESLLAPAALGVVGGFGAASYELALRGLVLHLEQGKRG
jgi:3-dehydroquinate dehydratase-2